MASASFIEITSDLYTQNLVEFFRHDAEIAEWLAHRWEKEELQHGVALKKYVQTAWPEIDWEAAYAAFGVDYGAICTVEALAGTKALEMVARCVVETGTASFYRMLSDLSPDPVLRRLAAEISSDEVRHYKHFHRYFRRYRQLERPSRFAVMRTCSSGPPTSRPRTRSMPSARCSAAAIREWSFSAATTTPIATACSIWCAGISRTAWR